jgi:hypothetical protein
MNLSSNWFAEPVFDFEYKKYQLLGYLKAKQQELDAQKIFPHIEELESHQSALEKFLHKKNQLDESFRKELTGFNLKTVELHYENLDEAKELNEVMDIVRYSLEKIAGCHQHFTTEAEDIRHKIQVGLLGLLPSYLNEGFVLIRQKKIISVFNYQVQPVLNKKGEKRLAYTYLGKHGASFTVNEQTVKTDLQKKYRNQFGHPAFFHVNTSYDLPIYETILPLASEEIIDWIE